MKKEQTRTRPDPLRYALGIAVVGALLVLLSGCATHAPLATYNAVSHAMYAVQVADEEDADKGAPTEFELAARRLALSQAAYEADQYEEARRLAEQAHIHARIAASRTQTMNTYAAISALERQIVAAQSNSVSALNNEANK